MEPDNYSFVRKIKSFCSLEKLIILFLILLVVIPIIVYRIDFDGDRSYNIQDWAGFSTYLGVFISFANLLVFIVLTYKIHDYNVNRDAIERPVIVFSKDSKDDCYRLINVGRGPALNITLWVNANESSTIWEKGYLMYAATPSEKIKIEAYPVNKMLAVYHDIYNNTFYSFINNDQTRIFMGSNYPSEIDIALSDGIKPTWVSGEFPIA